MQSQPNDQEEAYFTIDAKKDAPNFTINNMGTMHFGNSEASQFSANSGGVNSLSQSHHVHYLFSLFADKKKTLWLGVYAWVAAIFAGAFGNVMSDVFLSYLRHN